MAVSKIQPSIQAHHQHNGCLVALWFPKKWAAFLITTQLRYTTLHAKTRTIQVCSLLVVPPPPCGKGRWSLRRQMHRPHQVPSSSSILINATKIGPRRPLTTLHMCINQTKCRKWAMYEHSEPCGALTKQGG